ncbi:hypothetical protein Lcho_4083 [Leptothrix cholodnii SP-6]|uniref:DUF5636 domain-containing protein n=1 Tax=Leptothrix cholodnii (strain ATCC 51168 / LMG 8142 / SP-6) TaxID=395495 RepID=B1XWY6_LEPCP|nr:LirA/MavJ family T4SS effector [Leptothrix cholodnii]ACB36335.1 hypothetical protein Lcho_4083 [Leptothrix cholodnii SP-6]
MTFPITDTLTPGDFDRDFIQKYWGAARVSFAKDTRMMPLREAILQSGDLPPVKNAAQLVDDYCAIAAFLARPALVLKTLEVLEAELVLRMKKDQKTASGVSSYTPSDMTRKGHQIDCVFKTHKLLSGALAEVEFAHGFNNPGIQSHLHSNAYVLAKGEGGFVNKQWDPQERGRSSKDPLPLPGGVPTSMGNVGSQDFNRVLLRHGYQFKDVGAGNDHGEYSHRLQWYAIMTACNVTHTLALANTPLQIFKSLGSVFTRGNVVPAKPDIHFIYLWETIFDCFVDAKTAQEQKSIAWCKGTFNSPNYLNRELCTIKADALATLRVLMNVRYQKRRRDADLAISKLEKLRVQSRYKITEAYYTPKQDKERAGDSTGLLAWYLTN